MHPMSCTLQNPLLLLASEECFRQMSPCQQLHDLSRGHTAAASAAVMQTKAQSYYLQRALATLPQ